MSQVDRIILEEKMSTVYRAVIHCDRRDSGKCHGLIEVSASGPHIAPNAVHRAARDKGWTRGYRASGTVDVCPGCQTPEERAMIRSDAVADKEAVTP